VIVLGLTPVSAAAASLLEGSTGIEWIIESGHDVLPAVAMLGEARLAMAVPLRKTRQGSGFSFFFQMHA
jgi:hypothetical protein